MNGLASLLEQPQIQSQIGVVRDERLATMRQSNRRKRYGARGLADRLVDPENGQQLGTQRGLVMENAAFHKRCDAQQAISAAGQILEYLPPYSPDLGSDRTQNKRR